MPSRIRVALAVVLGCNLAALPALPALAHGPITRTAEGDPAPARLFAADSATGEVVVIDLPAGNVVTRLATPPSLLSLGLGGDDRWLFAMRGRDNRRGVVTVIDTARRPSGGFVFPAVVRSWEARAPGGVRDGRIATVGGNDAIFQEEKGELT